LEAAAPPGACCCDSHRATVELSRRATLQQWSGPPTVAVTNLELCCCCCCCWRHSYLATVANAGIGWRGRVLSCNSNLLVSVLNQSFSGVRFSSEVQSISPLSFLPTYSTVAPVLIDAQGTKLIAVLCRLVLPTAW
jgi:hypothetical protein